MILVRFAEIAGIAIGVRRAVSAVGLSRVALSESGPRILLGLAKEAF